MPGCLSKLPTERAWSACCATAHGPHLLVDRLKQRGADLVYRCGKGHAEPLQSDKYASELVLKPLELLHLAHLAPPQTSHPPNPNRAHLQRICGPR